MNADYGRVARRLTALNVAVSLAMAGPLLWVSLNYGSKLALAQAADSFNDSATAFALLYSLWLGNRPADDDHPRGHQRAEPIAALLAAVMAGVLAVEVFREALVALLGDAAPQLSWVLVAAFSFKVVVRSVLSQRARVHHRQSGSPALRALEVDARNDVLVGLLSIFGFFAARYGWYGWDAWLAMPVACWIGASGVSLARENIRLLMGEAAPPERHAQLEQIASSVAGVRSVHDLTARYEGAQLEVTLHIVVDEELSLRKAHDIADSVERELMKQPDVLLSMVHVDVEEDPTPIEATAGG